MCYLILLLLLSYLFSYFLTLTQSAALILAKPYLSEQPESDSRSFSNDQLRHPAAVAARKAPPASPANRSASPGGRKNYHSVSNLPSAAGAAKQIRRSNSRECVKRHFDGRSLYRKTETEDFECSQNYTVASSNSSSM